MTSEEKKNCEKGIHDFVTIKIDPITGMRGRLSICLVCLRINYLNQRLTRYLLQE